MVEGAMIAVEAALVDVGAPALLAARRQSLDAVGVVGAVEVVPRPYKSFPEVPRSTILALNKRPKHSPRS